MVGHDDEPDAASIELEQFIGQDAESDSLRLIVIEQPAAVVTRKGDEVNVQGIIHSAEFAHSAIF